MILTLNWLVGFGLGKLKGCNTYIQFEILLIRSLAKLVNIYDFQPLSVKWPCNHDRGSEGLLYHSLITLWVILFSANSKSIQNWNPKPIIFLPLKFQSFRIAAMYIHLIFQTQIFKFCQLKFVLTWCINILVGNWHIGTSSLYFAQTWEISVEGASTLVPKWHV